MWALNSPLSRNRPPMCTLPVGQCKADVIYSYTLVKVFSSSFVVVEISFLPYLSPLIYVPSSHQRLSFLRACATLNTVYDSKLHSSSSFEEIDSLNIAQCCPLSPSIRFLSCNCNLFTLRLHVVAVVEKYDKIAVQIHETLQVCSFQGLTIHCSCLPMSSEDDQFPTGCQGTLKALK